MNVPLVMALASASVHLGVCAARRAAPNMSRAVACAACGAGLYAGGVVLHAGVKESFAKLIAEEGSRTVGLYVGIGALVLSWVCLRQLVTELRRAFARPVEAKLPPREPPS